MPSYKLFKQVWWIALIYGAIRDHYYIHDDKLVIYKRKLLHYKNETSNITYENINVTSKTTFFGWLFSSWMFKWTGLGWGVVTIQIDGENIILDYVHNYKEFVTQIMLARTNYISRLYK